MVIFTRTFDLLTWLLPHAERFPKAQRFAVTQRLIGAALDFQEALFDAQATAARTTRQTPDRRQRPPGQTAALPASGAAVGLAECGQYRHVSLIVAEVGRLLGGWMKSL